jgi:lipopolysaccharide/colanic/teichoic acid biosynthesis glycosyltransferase
MSQTQLLHRHPFSSWCFSPTKRALDVTVAFFALTLTAPLMLVITLAIKATSRGPTLFRQERSGLNGRPFQLLKFRTMQAEPSTGTLRLTLRGDKRITSIGKWLRAWKLDELPQFINVLQGEMSIVGPRPDVAEFWLQVSENDRAALAIKPGITGAASTAFINEEELLAQVPASELAERYVREILPRKARLDLAYAARASFWSDCAILTGTLLRIFCPQHPAIPRNADHDNEQFS